MYTLVWKYGKKFIPIILILAGVFWSGWEWRDKEADIEILTLNKSIKELALKASEEAIQRDKELNNALTRVTKKNAEIELLKSKEDKIVYKELIKYVEKENPNTECQSLDTEWVQLYNQSIRASMPTN